MLLRRITEHVKAQNWTAVALDFVIVVVGVFIGIQVANWNEVTSKRRNANTMLEQLVVDLNNEAAGIEGMEKYFQTTKAYAQTAVDGFNKNITNSDRQFVVSAYQASQMIFGASNRATYEQMIASGDINIAGDRDLRAAVISYYVADWSTRSDNSTVTPYRANIRRAIPHEIQSAIRKNCGDQIVFMGTISMIVLPPSCDFEMADELFVSAASALRAQPGLLMDLRLHLSDLDVKSQNLRQQKQQIDSMLIKAKKIAP